MSETKNPKEKVSRRKVTTDLGRQIMQRERQRLMREQAALGEQMAEEAKRRMAMKRQNKHAVKEVEIGIERGLVRRLAAVLASEGVDAKLLVTASAGKTNAYTDFTNIVIQYEKHDDVRLLAAILRALVYHEGGHCRWTVPFLDLAEMATGHYDRNTMDQYHRAWNVLEDQRMESAVVSDSPVKASYFTPMVMAEMTDTLDAAAANWPLLIGRKYLPRKVRMGARKLFVLKHNLQGIDGNALAKSWENVVARYVLADNAADMWECVIEAHALLAQTQPVPAADSKMGHQNQGRKDADDLQDALTIPLSPDMLPDMPEDEQDDEGEPGEPLMIDGVPVVFAIPQQAEAEEGQGAGSPTPGSDQGNTDGGAESDEGDAESKDGSKPAKGGKPGSNDEQDDDDSGDDAAHDGAAGEVDDEADDESDDDYGYGDEDDDESDDDDDSDEVGSRKQQFANDGARESGIDPEREGGSFGSHSDEDGDEDDETLDYGDNDDLSEEDLQAAIDAAEAERDADPSLNADVRAFQDVVDTRVSDLTPYTTHLSDDVEAAAAAHNLAQDLEESFQQSTMDSAPQWVEQQRRGVLNVMRYKTRQAGDVEVFRSWVEDDAPGLNVSVSVLLDYSGSMGGYTKELAQAGYASKLACERLGIPCTVVLWDTDAKVLWDANEQADGLPVITSRGGTNPTVALADLDNQHFGKAQHVVLIMTDGEWEANACNAGFLASYKADGRLLIGCGFNSGYGTADSLADKLRRYGCDDSYAIKSLMEIPRLLEQTLSAIS